MTAQELIEEVATEFECLDTTIGLVVELNSIIAGNDPDNFQKAAVNQFISEFYNGIENILKRICKFNNVPVPHGGDSHINLFNMFVVNNNSSLPVIFDAQIADELIKIRKFRHFVIHGYSFKIEWEYLKESVGKIDFIYQQLKQNLNRYLIPLSE